MKIAFVKNPDGSVVAQYLDCPFQEKQKQREVIATVPESVFNYVPLDVYGYLFELGRAYERGQQQAAEAALAQRLMEASDIS